MKNKLLILMLSLVLTSYSMKKGYVWQPKKEQKIHNETEKEKDVQHDVEIVSVDENILNFLGSLEPLLGDINTKKTKISLSDAIFNHYKNNPQEIISLLEVANNLKNNTEGDDKKLGKLIKNGCIEFIAQAAFRMSEISSIPISADYFVKGLLGQTLTIPSLDYDMYDEYVNEKSGWFNSDDTINFSKPYLEELTRKACSWLDSLPLSQEDSELIASKIFESNLNEVTAATYYRGNDIPWFGLSKVHYSPDDQMIALGSDSGIVIHTTNESLQFGYGKVIDLSFSQDNKFIAAAYESNPSVRLYNIDTKNRVCEGLLNKSYVSAIPLCMIKGKLFGNNLDSDIKRIYSGNVPFNNIESQELTGHTATVLSLEMHHDGNKALSGSADKTVRIWDIERQLAETRQLQDKVYDVCFLSVDENTFLTASKEANVWDIRTKAPALTLVDAAVTIDPCPDGSQFLIAGKIGRGTWTAPMSNGVGIYDIRAGKFAHEFHLKHVIEEARFSPKSSEKFFIRYAIGNVQFLVDDGDEQEIRLDRRDLNPQKDFITTACAYSNNGNNFAKVGYFALTSWQNPERFFQGSSLIERTLSDSSKRSLGKEFKASRALKTRFTEALKEQAQSKYYPEKY